MIYYDISLFFSTLLSSRNGMTSSSPLIGVFCGQNIPKRIPSFTNHLYLHFHSDSSHNAGEFLLQWDRTSSTCGGILDSYSGSIQSPHYPELVSGASKCKWHIIVNKGSTIKIHIKQIGASDDVCSGKHVRVFDGAIADFNELELNCGAAAESTIETSKNEAVVTYISHIDENIGGFFLNYTMNCIHELRDRDGIIESPNFPALYPNQMNCQWKISGEDGEKIAIDVSHLDMEQLTSNSNCQFDYLEIVQLKNNEILSREKYCHTKPETISTLGEQAIINFKTDAHDKGSGFHLEYKILGCGETLTKPFGRIESANYPYSHNANCIWVIKTDIGYSLELTLNVELNSRDNCKGNMLVVSLAIHIYFAFIDEVLLPCRFLPDHRELTKLQNIVIRRLVMW